VHGVRVFEIKSLDLPDDFFDDFSSSFQGENYAFYLVARSRTDERLVLL
jgi:hypothetical protein